MSFDLQLFADKLARYRKMFGESREDLADATGISIDALARLEGAEREPSGDEVLILADHFRCDFKFFISNEQLAPIEQTEKLFRAHSKELSSRDRWSIQEFLFLCENEAFLLREVERPQALNVRPIVRGTYFKRHGVETAYEVRRALGLHPLEVPEIFSELRRMGMHVFRRKLENKGISGLFLNHPTAGGCVLVNYDEDVYRQRFTAAHEAAHAIFDAADEYVVSFAKWDHGDLREVRANAFAGAFLVPKELIDKLPDTAWTDDRLRSLADEMGVNVKVLLIALEREGRLTDAEARRFSSVKVPVQQKEDPEVSGGLSPRSKQRRKGLLERGISNFYAELCFEAFQRHVISSARLAEMLLVDQSEMSGMASLFGVRAS